jgi:hypothetical protein
MAGRDQEQRRADRYAELVGLALFEPECQTWGMVFAVADEALRMEEERGLLCLIADLDAALALDSPWRREIDAAGGGLVRE